MKILVVEDDRALAATVRETLSARSHTVEVSSDGADGLFLAKSYEYDAIVLDNNLPRKDGLSVCRELRLSGKGTPVLFMSVDSEVDTKMHAFRSGADDYITKPFSLEELEARLDAVTRRTAMGGPGGEAAKRGGGIPGEAVKLGDLSLDPLTQTVTRGGAPVTLTRKEYSMLRYFMRHAGTIVSRAQLMEHVWTADSNPFSNTVETHICNLRTKLNAGGRANLLINMPGRGYMLDIPENLKRFIKR